MRLKTQQPRSWKRLLSPEITIEDDRGRSVLLWSYRRRSAMEDTEQERALAQRVSFLSAAETRRTTLLFGLIPMAIVLLVSFLRLPTELGLALMFVAILGMTALIRQRLQRTVSPIVRRALLAECRCASCAYDIRGLVAANDGCVACPECHAAWKLDPFSVELRETREALHRRPVDPDETADDRRFRAGLGSVLAGLGFRRHYAVLDARERMVGLLDPGLFARRPPRWWQVLPERRAWVRIRLWAIGAPWRVLIALGFLPSILLNGFFFVRTPPGSLLSAPLSWIAFVAGAIWLPFLFLLVIVRPFSRTGMPIVMIMLREGHCPSCAASLHLAPRDESSTVECPACKAAWRCGPSRS